jgi:hypothetical protein
MKPGDLVHIDWKGLRLGMIVALHSRDGEGRETYNVLTESGEIKLISRCWLEVIGETR